MSEAEDLADELVFAKRLRPWIEWAGGEHMAAALAEANRAQMEAMF